ncbi:MAG: hypothetical protein QN141_13080 [Armatimonadota bacterium]|nr:hypothetical protein [Armatimonadota bacterium]MDR7452175.1 hypothetical protein [Armatimonadota bacterium]MDR7468058.1 hypothetical protein [Armatimonadota bacterium]MDR7494901.1 hypothetical protein [Armatimonadota bacterium]MDR7500298.1 hypothetical protein [Armatimonadota bacterium]
MDELLKVLAVLFTASLLVLGAGTLIQVVEQLLHRPQPGTRH